MPPKLKRKEIHPKGFAGIDGYTMQTLGMDAYFAHLERMKKAQEARIQRLGSAPPKNIIDGMEQHSGNANADGTT